MNAIKNILFQFDSDPVASSFDAVVAVDAGADVLVPYSNLKPDQIEGLVHGAMFTRSPSKLKHSAIFIGGSNVALAEHFYRQALATFFGPIRVSVAMDANGCNTTSVAAVENALLALQGPELVGRSWTQPTPAFVFGGTGPVGQRIAKLLAELGYLVHLHSRSGDRASQIAATLQAELEDPGVERFVGSSVTGTDLAERLIHCPLVFNASAAGVEVISAELMATVADSFGVMVDLNAVPPAGVAGVDPRDQHKRVGNRWVSGALAVGDWKMKLHRAVIQACFTANDRCFNLREIAGLSREMAGQAQ
jgi:hypothetical protein